MTALADVGPLAQLRAGRLGRRVPQLLLGLALFGVSRAMMVRAALGVAPWDVLHLGVTNYLPLSLGTVIISVNALVLLLWIPLREKPGIGTVLNALMVGPSVDATLAVFDRPDALAWRIALMLGGIALCGLASAMYMGAQFGRGPRDGLMIGLVRRTGLSIRVIRTGLEIVVVVAGLLLGGPLGVATVLFALAIGPLAQWMLPTWIVALEQAAR